MKNTVFKKIVAVCLGTALAVSLAACSKGGNGSGNGGGFGGFGGGSGNNEVQQVDPISQSISDLEVMRTDIPIL